MAIWEINLMPNSNRTYKSGAVDFRSVCDKWNNRTLRRKHTKSLPDPNGIGNGFLNRKTEKSQ